MVKVYVASRASNLDRGAMWRAYRSAGWNITSSWIDEDGVGQTKSFAELWQRIQNEIARSDGLIAYLPEQDLPFRGVLIEVGMALAMNKRVIAVSSVQANHARAILGSWINHPKVTLVTTLALAYSSLCNIVRVQKGV